MGMRVGTSSASMASQASAVSGWQQRQQGMKELFSKLNAGDLAGAQKAYAAFAANNNIKSDSPMGQLGDALKNGNLAAAEKLHSLCKKPCDQPSLCTSPCQQPTSGFNTEHAAWSRWSDRHLGLIPFVSTNKNPPVSGGFFVCLVRDQWLITDCP